LFFLISSATFIKTLKTVLFLFRYLIIQENKISILICLLFISSVSYLIVSLSHRFVHLIVEKYFLMFIISSLSSHFDEHNLNLTSLLNAFKTIMSVLFYSVQSGVFMKYVLSIIIFSIFSYTIVMEVEMFPILHVWKFLPTIILSTSRSQHGNALLFSF
jgi:hypothetical protein